MARLRIHRNDSPLFYKERNGKIIVTEVDGEFIAYYYVDFKSPNGAKLVFEFLTPKMETEKNVIECVVDCLRFRIQNINEFLDNTHRKTRFRSDEDRHSVNYVLPEDEIEGEFDEPIDDDLE